METNESYDKPSRIHWTAIISLCLCIIAALNVISMFLPLMDFERVLPPPVWVIPICSVSGMIFGCIALYLAQKPAWEKGVNLSGVCVFLGSVLILISLVLVLYVRQL
ncbi:MAG TPA: hypothetical protein VKY19_09125 [Ktedonosporobacter sp.]|nr:hypothetical protein [Ktedonosporobacter sp.]